MLQGFASCLMWGLGWLEMLRGGKEQGMLSWDHAAD